MNTRGKTFKMFEGKLSDIPGGAIAMNCESFSQGVLIEFFKNDGSSWVGNFGSGTAEANEVIEFPDKSRIIIFISGKMYIFDPNDPSSYKDTGILTYSFGKVLRADSGQYVTYDFTDVYVIETNGDVWRSERISWDGFKDVKIEGEIVTGLSWHAMALKDQEWFPFLINLLTKEINGGSYRQSVEVNLEMRQSKSKIIEPHINKIKIGKIGLVHGGENDGWYVMIEREQFGGHMILYNKEFRNPLQNLVPPEGFDNWVESEKLGQYVKEASLENVEWLN